MPACLHTGAFNGRPSGARHGAGGTDVTPRTDMNRGYSGSSQGTPAYYMLKIFFCLRSFRICCVVTDHTKASQTIHVQQSTGDSCWFHHLIELTVKSCAGSCWSSQEGWSAAAMSVGGYELPNGTAGGLTHPGPRESDPDRRARAAELLPAPAVLIT